MTRHNRVFLRPILNKTLYELWHGIAPNISYFRVFGSKCYILNTKDKLGKFDAKSNEAIFMGYSKHSRAYVLYNKKDQCMQESIHISIDESNPFVEKVVEDDEIGLHRSGDVPTSLDVTKEVEKEQGNEETNDVSKETHEVEKEPQDINDYLHGRTHEDLPKAWRMVKDHPQEQILGDVSKGVTTRSSLNHMCHYSAFVSQFVPNNINKL